MEEKDWKLFSKAEEVIIFTLTEIVKVPFKKQNITRKQLYLYLTILMTRLL
jgi:hypothetical protein